MTYMKVEETNDTNITRKVFRIEVKTRSKSSDNEYLIHFSNDISFAIRLMRTGVYCLMSTK